MKQPGGGCLLLGEWHLRGEPLLYLYCVQAVAQRKASALRLRAAGHHEESVEPAMGPAFDEQRGRIGDERCAGRERRCDSLLAGCGDARMEDAAEPRAGLRVGEDTGTESGAVERTGRQEEFRTKGCNHFAEAVASGRNNIAREPIGVDDGCSAIDKDAFDRALAAGDSTREADNARQGVDL